MRREIVSRSYKKPSLNLICPPNFVRKVSPTLIIRQAWQSKLEGHEENMVDPINTELNNKICGTQSQWYCSSPPLFEKQSANKGNDRFAATQSIIRRKKTVEFRKSVKKNSPYIKNLKEFDQMMLSIKPVQGPTESLLKQIKKHNDLNRKTVETVLMNSKESFQQKMTKFSSRIGLTNHERIFVMNSQDTHIRTMLQSNGWVEALDKDTTFFHLKWVYTDSVSDYSKLQQGQFYNHFRNNQELTNKNLLRKNLKRASPSQRPNFPETFDLQLVEDESKFQKQFMKNELFTQLQFWVNQFKKNFNKEFQKVQNNKSYILEKAGINQNGRSLFTMTSRFLKKNILVQKMKPSSLKTQQKRYLITFREYIYQFCQNFQKKCKATDIRVERRRSSFLIDQNVKGQIKQLLNTIHGFKNIDKIRQKHPQIQQFIQNIMQVLKEDPFIRVHLISLYLANMELYQNTFGMRNAWIVKPIGVSRGTGIKISEQLHNIAGKKYGKIVQKYIERPLILTCGRKFDIRQWVLVKSFTPLVAYTFKHCYGRFSSEKYKQSKFENLSIHLTNYSKQKQAFVRENSVADSILSEEALIQQLKIVKPQEKWKDIRNQINSQILKTLQCCQHELYQKSQCFEVYGFDILLDQQCRPWVLQVNLSPACEKRSQFLNEYLTQMGQGVLDIVEQKSPRNWEMLEESRLIEKSSKYIKIDSKDSAAQVIQKFWKMRKNHKK